MLPTGAMAVFLAFAPAAASGQAITRGDFQLGIGFNAGAHATRYESEITILGFSKKDSHNDGAVTVTVPLEAQYSFTDRFSLGLYIEPGSYLDSSGTHPNKLLLLGISPRYYVVNKDRFALYVHVDLGLSKLQIKDVKSGKDRFTDYFEGSHARLGVAGQYYFSDLFGLNAGLRFTGANFAWKERDPSDPLIAAFNYKGTLKTTGVQFQLGLQVKF